MNELFNKFSNNLKKILVMSERIASEQSSTLDTQHQLLALIFLKGTLANDILGLFDISVERAQLVATLVSGNSAKKTISSVSGTAKQAIQLAVQYASKYNHNVVDCEHLLLALVSNKSFNSYAVIERMGISPKDIKKQLSSVFSEAKRSEESEPDQYDEPVIEDLSPEQGFGPIGPIPGLGRPAPQKKQSSLKQFAQNLNEMAKKGKIDPVIGRDDEIERLVQILVRRKKNNPVLIGEPGVGKTAIVEGLADKIVKGEVPAILINKEIFSLDLGSLLAGTMYRGQFEVRVKSLLEEVEKNQNIVLFIDELHTVIGAGSAEGSMDAANLLKPKLARGEIRLIGATTLDEYKKYIERDAAFERRFQPVLVSESTEQETIEILNGIKSFYEKHHKVKYDDSAIIAAATLSNRYIKDRFLPDKAIDLLDEAGASTNIQNKSQTEHIMLRKELEDTISKKDEAVTNERYEKATFLRQKELKLEKDLENIEKEATKNKKNQITEDDIAKIVSKWTGVPVQALATKEKSRFLNLEKNLKKHIIGQDEAISIISRALRRARVGIKDPRRPIGSFVFLGPTGVGKTELVKVLAREIYGSEKSLIKIDMSEFMERHNVSRLIGAPAGYVGYEEGGRLTEQIRRNPYSIILFDEIEKAHPEVFNVLLQIMEDGELTDAKGRRVDFKNALIVLTSNLGSDLLNKQNLIGFGKSESSKNTPLDFEKTESNIKEMVEKNFRPEFLNRLDGVIIFKPLSKESVRKIVNIEFKKVIDRFNALKIHLKLENSAADLIAKRGFKPEFGARPMRGIISENIEDPIGEGILKGEYKEGDTIKISASKSTFKITKIQPNKKLS